MESLFCIYWPYYALTPALFVTQHLWTSLWFRLQKLKWILNPKYVGFFFFRMPGAYFLVDRVVLSITRIPGALSYLLAVCRGSVALPRTAASPPHHSSLRNFNLCSVTQMVHLQSWTTLNLYFHSRACTLSAAESNIFFPNCFLFYVAVRKRCERSRKINSLVGIAVS